jgi:hypothetical protein
MRPQTDQEKAVDAAMLHAGNAVTHAIVVLGADEEDVLERLQKDIQWAVDERNAAEIDATEDAGGHDR